MEEQRQQHEFQLNETVVKMQAKFEDTNRIWHDYQFL